MEGSNTTLLAYNTKSVFGLVCLPVLAYCLYAILYRLYLSPLAQFPGPKLAALTKAYQFYFDVIQKGHMPWELARLHQKYGPIVRIGPNEVHISDPDFHDVLYTNNTQRRDKDIFAINGFGLSKSVIATETHAHHRMRRAALNPFFSNQAVTKLHPVVNSKIDEFCRALATFQDCGEPVDLEVILLAMTTDIITEYSFAKSYDFLKQPGFSPDWPKVLVGAAQASNFFRYMPWLIELLNEAPPWIIKLIDPNILQLVRIKEDQKAQIKAIMSGRENTNQTAKHKTIFHELLQNESLPAEEKTLPRLAEEAQIIIAAGVTTTAHFLKCTIYYVLADSAILHRLQAELKEAIPDASVLPPMHILEQLPYLSAIVKEGSRLTGGAVSRLARISPDADIKFRDYTIPKGTSIGMSSYLIHQDSSLFPEPEVFNPERWLDKNAVALENYLVPFSRGTRACLGINLAKDEMYSTLAAVFRRFELELYKTTRADVDLAHDFFVPYVRLDSEGVRVTVKGSDLG